MAEETGDTDRPGWAIAHVTARSDGGPVDASLRVSLQCHPDRTTRDGVPFLAALARDGVYRSQFETGLRLAVDGNLDARVIGDAARAGPHGEQALKRVWHYVARFGTPRAPA